MPYKTKNSAMNTVVVDKYLTSSRASLCSTAVEARGVCPVWQSDDCGGWLVNSPVVVVVSLAIVDGGEVHQLSSEVLF